MNLQLCTSRHCRREQSAKTVIDESLPVRCSSAREPPRYFETLLLVFPLDLLPPGQATLATREQNESKAFVAAVTCC